MSTFLHIDLHEIVGSFLNENTFARSDRLQNFLILLLFLNNCLFPLYLKSFLPLSHLCHIPFPQFPQFLLQHHLVLPLLLKDFDGLFTALQFIHNFSISSLLPIISVCLPRPIIFKGFLSSVLKIKPLFVFDVVDRPQASIVLFDLISVLRL